MANKLIKNKSNPIIICFSSVFGTAASYANKLQSEFDKK
jgi:hypothetical protein